MKSLSDWRIVFLGTPDFAVASLRALQEAGAQVVAVVTAPDKPAGRGRQVQQTPVKQYALAHQIPVLQPQRLKDPEFLAALQVLQADLQVVVAFRMLPEVVWNMPPLGTLNVHASLLPQYRGAAPINWALIQGETQTGVTTFRLKHEIDTGDILLQQAVAISPEDDAGSLHDKLMQAGADLLIKTLSGLQEGRVQDQPQPSETELRHAPKIFKEDCRIDWQQNGAQILNFIRGLSPRPAAFLMHEGKMWKVFRAHHEPATPGCAGGTQETDGKSYLRVACADGWVYLDELQQEGKKRMDIPSFLRGFHA